MAACRVRTFREADRDAVLALWERAGINRPWLDLAAEITAKRRRDRSLFLVAIASSQLVGAVMGAFDGRRGWVYHLAVEPAAQGHGIGRALMAALEARMRRRGVTKLNLQVRAGNEAVLGFYARLGYVDEQLTSMSKRLDQ